MKSDMFQKIMIKGNQKTIAWAKHLLSKFFFLYRLLFQLIRRQTLQVNYWMPIFNKFWKLMMKSYLMRISSHLLLMNRALIQRQIMSKAEHLDSVTQYMIEKRELFNNWNQHNAVSFELNSSITLSLYKKLYAFANMATQLRVINNCYKLQHSF